MTNHERKLAEKLFAAVEVEPPNAVIEAGEEQLLDVGVAGAVTVLYRGRALELLRDLQERLAKSALAAGGPAAATLEQLLIAAAREAHAHGPAAGVAFIAQELAKARRTWRVFEPTNVAFPGSPLRLGQCTLHQQLPDDVPRDVLRASGIDVDFGGQVLEAEVAAADVGSARLLAADRFAEARALMTVIDRSACRLRYAPLTVDSDPNGLITVAAGGRGWILYGAVDDEGRLSPRYAPLDAAAAKPEGRRNDWERRTVAAARWFAKACETTWPAEALTAGMTALDTIWVEGVTREQGKLLAKRAQDEWSKIHPVGESTGEWVVRLYRARSEATHVGREFVEDLEIARLLDLVQAAVRRAVWHLHPLHRPAGACTSLADTASPH